MGRIVTTTAMTHAELAELVRPRDEAFVAERAADPATEPADGTCLTFEAIDGPFETYRRTVEVGPPDGSDRRLVTERVEYRLAIPFWAWLYHFPVRAALRDRATNGSRRWWAPPDRFDRASARAMGLGGAAAVIAGVLSALATQTLTFAADEFGTTSDTNQANVFSILRIGIVVSALALTLADRKGRRILLLSSAAVGITLAFAAAFAPNLETFTVLHLLCRNLGLTVGTLALIVTAEEVPAGSRAYAAAIIAMATGVGVGSVVALHPVADAFGGGWRVVHAAVLALVPVLLMMKHRLPETHRFEEQVAHPVGPEHHMRSDRLVLLGAAALLVNVFVAPATQLQNEFLRDRQHMAGWELTLFLTFTNGPPAMFGTVVGGRLADLHGRRRIAAIGLIGYAVANAAMFSLSGWGVWAASFVGSLVGGLMVPSLGVYGPELFPTERRGRGNGIVSIAGVTGSVVGLQVAGRLVDRWDDYGNAFALCAIGPLLVAGLVFLFFPETAHRELEELNA